MFSVNFLRYTPEWCCRKAENNDVAVLRASKAFSWDRGLEKRSCSFVLPTVIKTEKRSERREKKKLFIIFSRIFNLFFVRGEFLRCSCDGKINAKERKQNEKKVWKSEWQIHVCLKWNQSCCYELCYCCCCYFVIKLKKIWKFNSVFLLLMIVELIDNKIQISSYRSQKKILHVTRLNASIFLKSVVGSARKRMKKVTSRQRRLSEWANEKRKLSKIIYSECLMIEFSFQMKHKTRNDFFPLRFLLRQHQPTWKQSQVWMKNKLYVKAKLSSLLVTLMFFSTLNITKIYVTTTTGDDYVALCECVNVKIISTWIFRVLLARSLVVVSYWISTWLFCLLFIFLFFCEALCLTEEKFYFLYFRGLEKQKQNE